MLFETGMLNRPKVRTHRGRNGDDKRDGGANGASTDGEHSHTEDDSGAAAGGGGGDQLSERRSRNRSARDRRETSSSSSGGSAESPGLTWDPHVAAVLFRMHREMQHIGRQLDMLENILITQQRLMHATLSHTVHANRSRLWFFKNMPWRTIVFILAWPFFANFLVRFIYRRISRNGSKLRLRAKIL